MSGATTGLPTPDAGTGGAEEKYKYPFHCTTALVTQTENVRKNYTQQHHLAPTPVANVEFAISLLRQNPGQGF
mgnify:FL=1